MRLPWIATAQGSLVLLMVVGCDGETAPASAPAAAVPAPSGSPSKPPEVPPDEPGESVDEVIFVGGVEPPQGPVAFTGMDAHAKAFLRCPSLKPAVPFGCCRFATPYEDAIEAALQTGGPAVQLDALDLLIRVRAPSSVAIQWRMLQVLDTPDADPPAHGRLRTLRDAFSADRLLAAIATEPPADRFSEDTALSWAIRAAGVTRLEAALPRLRELSRGENLDASLAAEASLEDFAGPDGDAALVECLLGWRYNAYMHAAHALLQRNPALLRATLRAAMPPEDCRWQQGLFLSRCDDPAAVPILCETVGHYHMIDGEMFDQVARLALAEQLTLIEALPDHVRPEQRARAEAVLASVRARLAGSRAAPR